MPSRPVHTKIDALPRDIAFGGAVERCAVRSDESLITFNWIDPSGGEKPPPHSHPFDQLSFVLQGQMEFDIDGERFLLGPGECLAIPADAPHTARIMGDETVLNVDVFAPVRPDYLNLVTHDPEAFAGDA
jgi:mannose-6-phosphate isomerase-like protein (cupin superfamily)